jgi:2-dehydropantoate 2-reductase
MHILILGAGGIGGYVGGRLIEGGVDATFLVREGRLKQIAEKGIRIESMYGNVAVAAKAITKSQIDKPADVILLTCKAYDLASAIETIAPAVGPQTAILPLLNGIAHIDTLNAKFGRARVLAGAAKIPATLTPDGVIKHLGDWRYITFGEQDGALSPRATALKAVFDKTSIQATASPNIMQIMWDKIVHLATVAGMTCTMRASVGEIARTKYGADIMVEFLERNAEIAKCEGYAPSDSFLAEYRQLFRNKESTYTASMLRDIEREGQIEADHVLGFMLEKAIKHNLDSTYHRFVYTHLKAYEERRAAKLAKAEPVRAAS